MRQRHGSSKEHWKSNQFYDPNHIILMLNFDWISGNWFEVDGYRTDIVQIQFVGLLLFIFIKTMVTTKKNTKCKFIFKLLVTSLVFLYNSSVSFSEIFFLQLCYFILLFSILCAVTDSSNSSIKQALLIT